MADALSLKEMLLRRAGELGFCAAGVAPPAIPEHAGRYRNFLARGLHAGMSYLQRRPEARCDAGKLLPGARSVICLALSYAPAAGTDAGAIARYARGRDYHRVLAARCRKLFLDMRTLAPAVQAKVCADTAAISDRTFAAAAGIGWIGRNGCLIHARLGSYLVLAEIITDLPLPPDRPMKNRCAGCRACAEACPTGAIGADGLIDCRRCISYLTIEHRGPIEAELAGKMGARLFGCDRCQEVCPHNRKAPAGDPELLGPSQLAKTTAGEALHWRQADWDRLTRGSAGRRAKHEMFLRNAAIAAGNAGPPSLPRRLEELSDSASAMVSSAARWALERINTAP